MSSLSHILKYKEISELGYSSVYEEKIVPDIIDFNWKNILRKPHTNTSNSTVTELKLISKYTLSRSEKDIELVMLVDEDPDKLFEDLCKKNKIDYPFSKINEFYEIIKPVLLNVKSLYNRPRPVQLAGFYNIKIDVIATDTHHTAAYPSGHTVYSKLVALILKELYPILKSNDLDILVDMTARARILQGVHYPSDNEASLILSTILFKKLKDKIL